MFWRHTAIAPLSAYFLTLAITPASAQVIPILSDATLGTENSKVTAIDAMSDQIDGGALRGSNLFHSFQNFNIESKHSVYFSDRGASNIFARVTGSLPSNIDGRLGTGTLATPGSANLFLINPNGISFGTDARLALGGSFLATTASSILFPDGSTFSTNKPATSSPLTVDVQAPIGLQFEGKPASIAVGLLEGSTTSLSVAPGKNIALLGGTISVIGKYGTTETTLQAQEGKITLGSLANTGLIGIKDGSIEFPQDFNRADIIITRAASLNVGGQNSGLLSIYGNNINISDSSNFIGNTSINSPSKVEIDGASRLTGDLLKISSGDLDITGGAILSGSTDFNIVNQVQIMNAGQLKGRLVKENSDLLKINSDNLAIKGSAILTGNMAFNISKNIQIDGSSQLTGGTIKFNSTTLSVLNSAVIKGTDLIIKTLGGTTIEKGGKILIDGRFKLDARSVEILSAKSEDINLGDAQFDVMGNVKLSGSRIDGRTFILNAGSLTIGERSEIVTGDAQFNISEGVNLSNKSRIDSKKFDLSSGSLILSDRSEIATGRLPSGNIGKIILKVDEISLSMSKLFTGVSPNTEKPSGDAGSITIITNSLKVQQNSEINSSQSGNGKGGRIFIKARDDVSFDGKSNIYSSVSKDATGTSGDIIIKAGSLDVSGVSQLNASLSGTGSAGNITLEIRGLTSLKGTEGTDNSSLLATVSSSGNGSTGNIDIKTSSLFIDEQAQIVNGNSGRNFGKSGNIKIVARDRVDVVGGGGIRAGVDKFAKTKENPNPGIAAGNIDITARSVLVGNGAQIEIKLFGENQQQSDKAISITATNSVIIDGYAKSFDTGILTDVQGGGLGNAAAIKIDTPKLILKNKAQISASTSSGDGGNIRLSNIGLLLLRKNSKISATAGRDQLNGNGGNITIDAKNGFIIAVPSENSDITANSSLDKGGKITIDAIAIYGLVPRSRADVLRYISYLDGQKPEDIAFDKLDPNRIPTSDISAISQQNATLNGQVIVNAAVNPNQGINQLLKEPRTTDVADSCQVSNGKESIQFFDIGRGGLPPRPEDPLSVDLLEWQPSLESRITLKSPTSNAARSIEVTSLDRPPLNFQASTLALRLIPPCQTH
jgi:filamentous hemagglutinin family protein